MPQLSPVDAVAPAFRRVDFILLHPFRLRTWLKMGLIGWLGGGLVTVGMNLKFQAPHFPVEQLPSDPWKDNQSGDSRRRSLHPLCSICRVHGFADDCAGVRSGFFPDFHLPFQPLPLHPV
jgi:hypothetical protein